MTVVLLHAESRVAVYVAVQCGIARQYGYMGAVTGNAGTGTGLGGLDP